MISSLNNATVKATVRLRKRRERDKRGTFLVEGRRAVGGALSAGVKIHELFYLPGARRLSGDLIRQADRAGAAVHEVSDAVMGHLTTLEHPPDLLAVAPMRPASVQQATAGDYVLVLCGIRDPAVAGGVLAAAAGAEATGAVCTASTTDVFSPPCARAAAGAHFVMPLAVAHEGDVVAKALSAHRRIALCGEGTPVCSTTMERPLALIVCGDAVPQAFGDAERVCIQTGPHGVGPGIVAAAAVALYRVGRT